MSTINYTYNVIVDRFRQFAAGHFQLRRFTHGEISQADLEKEAEWPWLHVKPRAINYSPGTRSFSFEIFISDLPRDKEDKTGYQAESITDCSLIFQDLINEIYLGNMFGSDVVLTRPVNAEPFVEQYTHTLTGVTGTIELNLDYDWSACSIPASWNYNTPTDSPSDGWGALQFIESLDQNGVFVSLLNDVEAPGNSYYYGTNASGVKGWYAIVDNVGLTCETLPDCATIISILDDIATLQTDVALKANTADLGATAFSNSYNDLDNLPTIPAQYNPTAGTGVSITGTYPNQTITNTAPDQTVALTAGTNIGVTGTYPNFTISNTQSLAGYVPTTRSITINGTTQDLSADRTFTIATGLTVGTTPITSGTVGRVLFEGTGNVLQESANLFWDNTNSRLGIGTASPGYGISHVGTSGAASFFSQRDFAFNVISQIPQRAYFYGKYINSVDAGIGIGGNARNNTSIQAFNPNTNTATLLSLNYLGGNVIIGDYAADAGYKLDVNGTARVVGTGTTFATTAFSVQNSLGNNMLRVRDDARVFVGVSTSPFFGAMNRVTTGGEVTGEGFIFNCNGNSSGTDYLFGGSNINASSGTITTFLAQRNFQPSSGSAVHNVVRIASIINQTGGANGITRGLLIEPTLTAAADYRAIETTAGNVMLNTTSGNTLIGTTTNAGYKLDVNGTARVKGTGTTNTTIALTVQNSASTDVLKVGDGSYLYCYGDVWIDNDFRRIFSGAGRNAVTRTASGTSTIFYNAMQLASGAAAWSFYSDQTYNLTAGSINGMYVRNTFAPTSGTSTFTALEVLSTINQTGGASGITRGLYINPTLTAAADYRAIETARGNVVFGNLPTSSAGLPTGALWNDAGTVKIV